MIRVAFFIAYFSGEGGGTINHILELTKHLRKYPIKTTGYTSSDIDHSGSKKTFLNQKLTSNFIIKRFNSYWRFGDYRVSFGLIRTLLKDAKNFDIFHSHSFRSFQEDIAAFTALIKKKKLIITTHGNLSANMTYFEYFSKRIYDLSDTFLKNKLLDIDYIAVAKMEVDLLKKFGISNGKIHYIPHGIDTNHFKPLDSFEILKKHKLEKKKIILYVGRIAKIKGIEILIEAFDLLVKEIADAYLVIVGADYNYKHVIDKLIKKKNLQNKILILGFIPKKIMPKIYSMANVVVCPSKFEIFGLVILEANACQKIVIASNQGGPKEIIINGKNGFLTKYGDIEKLKETIIYVLNNEELQYKNGKFAREYVKNNFSWEKNAYKHYNLYKMILDK